MKIKIVGVFAICLIIAEHAIAQNDADVLRYSIINWGSTARTLGMGNAFGALGADPSAMATNPGGMGLYKRSEFTFSPTFTLRNITSDFLGKNTDDNHFRFNFGNLGFVWAFPKDDANQDWKGFTFGIGYNRLNDFSGTSFAEGVNQKNSLLDSYIDQVNNNHISPENFPDQYPLDIDLAWQTFLLDTNSNGLYSAIPSGGARQRYSVETKGGMGEWDFSVGGNYLDKLYIGGTLGILSINYKDDKIWEETDVDNTIASSDSTHNFKSYKYTQNLKVNGTGINLKFGMIYKLNDQIRIGAAVHTPSFLSLTDDYKTSITAQYDGGTSNTQASPDFLPFDYKINTPFRFIGSLGIIVGKHGLLDADYEYLNYRKSSINPKDKTFKSDFIESNQTIKSRYTSAHNVRVGGEVRYNKLRFRLGTAYYGTPFAKGYNNSDTDQSRMSYNGGLGFRDENFYFDIGYSYTKTGSYEGVYATNDEVIGTKTNTMDHRLMLTIGFNY